MQFHGYLIYFKFIYLIDIMRILTYDIILLKRNIFST